jgi:hypothetical protein
MTWLVEKNTTLSKKSRLGEEFAYTLNQWDAQCYYCDDGLAEPDNNGRYAWVKRTTPSSTATTVASVEHYCMV